QRYELVGESARRIPSLELPWSEALRLPKAEWVYLEEPASDQAGHADPGAAELRPLHPLLIYDADAEEVLFLGARRGRKRTEYLCYTTGRTVDRPDLGTEQCALLARVLGMEIAEGQEERWAAQSQAEEPSSESVAVPA